MRITILTGNRLQRLGSLLPGREWVALVVIAVAVLVAPSLGSFSLYNMTLVGIFATAVVGLNLMLGLAGQISFTQSTFMAVGGYSSAVLTVRHGFDPWLAIVVGAVIAMVGAFLLGLPLLRLRGHYLGMATFALALGTASLANAATWLTGGPIGIAGVPPLRAFGQNLSANPKLFYVLTWIICGVALLTTVLLMRSYIGRAWRALATRQDIAASLGINVSRYRLLVLAIAAVMASVAGSLYAEYTAFTAPDFYDIGLVINLYFMLYVGGRGSILGPVLGAAFVVIVPEEISSLQSQANLVFFVALLLLILLRPGGILGSSRGNGSLSDTLPRPLQRRLAALRRPRTQPGVVS